MAPHDATPRSRIGPVDPANVSPAQRVVHDRIADTRGDVSAPFTVLLHAPELADRIQRVGAYLRYETVMERDLAEAAILATARAIASQYEWDTHEPYARRAGVPDEVIETLRADATTDRLPERYRTTIAYARSLASSGRVPDDAYAETVALLGTTATVELTVLVGYYSMLALTLNAHQIGASGSTIASGVNFG